MEDGGVDDERRRGVEAWKEKMRRVERSRSKKIRRFTRI